MGKRSADNGFVCYKEKGYNLEKRPEEQKKVYIDFHTHIFPDKIAAAAISQLEEIAGTGTCTDGTQNGLLKSMEKNGIRTSVILPVVTNPKQFHTINRVAMETNEKSDGRVISFGGIHPDQAADSGYKALIREMKSMGLPGIKLHPDYQGVMINDITCKRILDYATEQELWITVHSGWDPLSPDHVHCPPKLAAEVLKEIPGTRIILAHMGGFYCWDESEEYLAGQDVYMDMSICMSTMLNPICWKGKKDENNGGYASNHIKYVSGRLETPAQAARRFARIVKKHGAEKILWGTDSPWEDQGYTVEAFEKMDLTEKEKEQIRHLNAEKMLGL